MTPSYSSHVVAVHVDRCRHCHGPIHGVTVEIQSLDTHRTRTIWVHPAASPCPSPRPKLAPRPHGA